MIIVFYNFVRISLDHIPSFYLCALIKEEILCWGLIIPGTNGNTGSFNWCFWACENKVDRETSSSGAVFPNVVIAPCEARVWICSIFSGDRGMFATRCHFSRMVVPFCSKFEFTLEKRCVWSLRPVIQKWRRNFLLTDAGEVFLQKVFTMNLSILQ